ncbi:MAG: MBL fold metallo-hydrolase [Dorea sp.]
MVEFKTERLSDRVTRIFAACGECMYLLEGNNKAALIDTGSGFGSLRKVIESLTCKSVSVLLTHGHTDHAMGAGEFTNVYMNRLDDYIYIPHGDKKFRWEGILMLPMECQISESDYIPTAEVGNFKNIKGGDAFDLGGLTVEIYDCAGHTKGSVAMLIKEERMLILGDACNNFTFLFEDYSLSVEEYKSNLEKLEQETDGKYDRVLASHMSGELPMDIIRSVIDVCENILEGKADDIPFEFRGTTGFIAKAIRSPEEGRIDGKNGNVIYNKNKLYKRKP